MNKYSKLDLVGAEIKKRTVPVHGELIITVTADRFTRKFVISRENSDSAASVQRPVIYRKAVNSAV